MLSDGILERPWVAEREGSDVFAVPESPLDPEEPVVSVRVAVEAILF